MSWVNDRRGHPPPNPATTPPVQMYNPNQHSTQAQENQWSQNNWYGQQQQFPPQQKHEPDPTGGNYWHQPQNTTTHAYNHNNAQYGNYMDQQTAYYQNTGYQQSQQPSQQAFGNVQYNQQYQNNSYPNQQSQQVAEGDAWNWGWGDEDNSNVQQQSINNAPNATAGSIGDSFATDETWNWSVEDSKQVNQLDDVSKPNSEMFPKMGSLAPKHLKTENSHESKPQDHLTVKREKLNSQQWSVDSQMSQESSDDVLPTSESDKMMSRSSTVSHSPISGHDTLGQNLEDVPLKPEFNNMEVAGNHQHFENKEIVSNVKQEVTEVHTTNRVNPTPPPPIKTNPTPPPPKNTQTPPLPPPGASDDTKNPYKRTTVLSHKAANRQKTSPSSAFAYQPPFQHQNVNLETLPDNSEQPDPVPAASTPSFVKPTSSKPVQQWPDNNEAPMNDRNQYLETGQLSDASQHNFNQVLSNSKSDSNDALPPPGLRRMVLGQLEQNETAGNAGPFGDEPPPGLSRMVLGQTESNSNAPTANNDEDLRLQYEPPEGLHRMIPGESSSPEQTRRQAEDSETEFNQIATNAVPQQRSATIGADTPPVDSVTSSSSLLTSNRSETIGGGSSTSLPLSQDTTRQRGTSASSSESRVGAIGKNKGDSKKADHGKSDGRRDSIEGQTQDREVSNIINSVRNLTVGENTDDRTSNNSLNDNKVGRSSREESSDSDEPKNVSRSTRDKRYPEKSKHREKDRDRDRYTPDSYKDKKYDKRRHRDRRYEEDTEDYFSDKERSRRRDDRDYERKYSSLRKEKDKDRRRRDPRDSRDPRDARTGRDYGRDSRRNDYYYSRFDEDYDDERGSRPTSRSDSMHESYRDRGHERGDPRDRRHRDRDREHHRRHRESRDPYNPYQGYAYDPYNPYYQQYQYYENLRRTNPRAYAEWYRKYYQQATGQSSNYGTEDRASVHSGRSSANDELAKDRYTRQSYYSQTSLPQLGGYYGDTHTHSISGHYGLDNSSFSRPFDHTDSSLNFEDHSLTAQRMTPVKFATAHIKASITSGKLLKILPNYPMDGQMPAVEICNLQMVLEDDDEFRELNSFPGPLVKGVTHKKTIIEYCENKIRGAGFNNDIVDVDSYVLMWELLILLIRQNGMVVGTDIAELLLKNNKFLEINNVRPSSVLSSISSNAGDANILSETSNQHNSEAISGSTQSVLKEEEVTNKFREYLLYGSCKEALEWAMKHGLWGHALFLASKLDKRTYANVMMRFANGLTINDPLQTLYQLLSGRIPAAVTCVADEKWGDWRPHLAMILSNSTQRPELNCKAITSLGDTLLNRGSLYAAQFCYLMAQVGFGKHDHPETKLALLGSDHGKTFTQFATNEAIHMTEIYEYACSLNDPQFIIPEFQIYKYLLATRLADRGLLEKSLSYLEKLSSYIISSPSSVTPNLVDNVCNLADRLKFSDPVGDADVDETEFGGILETSRPDHSWLKDLRTIQNDIHAGLITQDQYQQFQQYTEPPVEELTLQQSYDSTNQEAWQQYQQPVQQQWQPEQLDQQQQHITQPTEQDFSGSQVQDQQQYWQNQSQWGEQQNHFAPETVDQQHNNYYASNEDVTPQISMPNQSKGKSPYDDTPLANESSKQDSPAKPKPKPASPEKSTSTGWFGGIFSKLAPKPKNQMKLPDDKNPKIVWDEDKKRWINVDDDGNETVSELKPPPKMSDMMPTMTQPRPNPGSEQPSSLPPMPGSNVAPQPTGAEPNPLKGGNMFKMQRGRNLKKSYVDVFNPNGAKSSGPASLPPNPEAMANPQLPKMNFFVPQTINDPNAPTDFLTPGGVPAQFNDSSQPQ